MTYRSKHDLWIALIVFPIMLALVGAGLVLLFLALMQILPYASLLPGLVLSIIGAMVLWAMFATSFEITPSDLVVRFGPICFRIPLDRIVAVKAKTRLSTDSAWGLAWSLDRVVIEYRRRSGKPAWLGVSISPRDKDAFLRELADNLVALEDRNQPEQLQ